MPDRLPLLAVVALAVAAGCAGFAPADPATTDSPTTASDAGTTVDTPPVADCGETWISFYGVGGDVQDRFWAPDAVSVGYSVPGNASVFLVAYEGGSPENATVLGVERVEYETGYSVTADGHAVELDAALSGEHTVSVVVHEDTDGDGEFDRTVDRACASDGELVRAGPSTFDFDEFAD